MIDEVAYYNLLISRLNKYIDEQVDSYKGVPIPPDFNINFVNGTVKGCMIAIDIMQEIAKELDTGKLELRDNGNNAEIIEGNKTIPIPHKIRNNFKYE